MNKALLHPEVADFIRKNYKKVLPELILKGSPFPDISIQELAIQLKGVKVAAKKFPLFYKNSNILYPPKLNLEQTSSEISAKHKASLIAGYSLTDLTGGFGIDSYFFSRNFSKINYCELNAALVATARHNFKALNATNIKIYTGNSLEILVDHNLKSDWIYADPARRDEYGDKVFKLSQCVPDIPKNLPLLWSFTNNIMLKTSPILDITAGINELEAIKEIHIVAVKNEVKEVLWILEKDFRESIILKTVNFEKDHIQKFEAIWKAETQSANLAPPMEYLYEPNAAIMKSGLFNELAQKTETQKLHINSHLFTSLELKKFPGRIFKIIDIESFKSNHIKKRLKKLKANIATRNFPLSVKELRQKYKIKDGGNLYLFFTTNLNDEKIVIFCEKL